MAFVRFGWGGSQLYIYESVYGGITCCGCLLYGSWATMRGPDPDPPLPEGEWPFPPREAYDEMIAHVEEHVAAGHRVIGDVIPRLIAARDDADIELTPEQDADREQADADIMDFMGWKDPELRARMGVKTPYEPHPDKQPCSCGSGKQVYLCTCEDE